MLLCSLGRIVIPLLSGFLGNNVNFVLSALLALGSAAAVLLYDKVVKRELKQQRMLQWE
jgi:hypothetical protein